MDWTEIEKMLQARVEDVCRHLLPQGKRDGAEWCCGDVTGAPGKSFRVNLSGKAGLWSDFANSGVGGKTLLSLWCSATGKEFREAIKEAKQFLGVRDDFNRRVLRPDGTRPQRVPAESKRTDEPKSINASIKNIKPLTEDCAAYRYLVEERWISPQVLAAYGVGQTLDCRGIVFPYFSAEVEEVTDKVVIKPELSWLKFEALKRVDGKKKEWTTTSPSKSLFGKNVIPSSQRELIITEGEKDALTWAVYGRPACSVPFGAKWKGQDKNKPSPNREWIDRDFEWLEQFETIYICFDNDDAGRKAAMDVINEIGPRRCRLVTLPQFDAQENPLKDANDCLKAGISIQEMEHALRTSKEFAPEKVKNASDFENEVYEDWFEKPHEAGLFLPIEFPFRIRNGEVTVWTGFGGHGKSQFLNYVMCGLMCQGERVCIASMEVRTRTTLHKMTQQAWGGMIWDHREAPLDPESTLAEEKHEAVKNLGRVMNWFGERLWLYDHVGIVPWQTLIEDFKFVRRRYGVTQFVIDSLMRCGIMEDDYVTQALFVTALANFADEYDCHVHLVAHRKKDEKGEKAGSLGDKSVVSGSAKITDNAANVVEVWRNVEKAQKVSNLKEEKRCGLLSEEGFKERLRELGTTPDGKFVLRKQRNGEVQDGARMIWFLYWALQYTDRPPDDPKHKPICFIEDDEPDKKAA